MKDKRMTLAERTKAHRERHPKDKNIRRPNRGITWSKFTTRDKRLERFYQTHIYTYVDEKDLSKKRWVRIIWDDDEEGVEE